MNKILRFVSVLFLSFIASSPAFSAPGWGTGYATISYIYPYDGGVNVYFTGNQFPDPSSSCTGRFAIYTGDANYDAKISALYLAFAAGKKIRIYYDSASTQCGVTIIAFRTE